MNSHTCPLPYHTLFIMQPCLVPTLLRALDW
jgi:hypothetical protein